MVNKKNMGLGSRTGGRKEAGPARKIPSSTYNKLWCVDLAIGRALQQCVLNTLRSPRDIAINK